MRSTVVRSVLAMAMFGQVAFATSAAGQGAARPVGGAWQQPRPPLNAEKRAAIERRLEARINDVIRQRLALNDEQYAKLREVSMHLEDDRRTLRNEEMTIRFSLRQELLAGDRVNEAKVAELLDKLPKVERRRGELLEQEQRELAKFLSPSQRARYSALQDELRRTMQDMQRRRVGVDAGADSVGGAPPPPRRRFPPAERS